MMKITSMFPIALLWFSSFVSSSSMKVFSGTPSIWTKAPSKKLKLKSIFRIIGGAGDEVNVQCLLQGKTFDLQVETVADVKREMKRITSYVDVFVSFRGEILSDDNAVLRQCGIHDADILSITVETTSEVSLRESLKPDAMANFGLSKEQKATMDDFMGGSGEIDGMMKQMGLDGPMTQDKIQQQMKSLLSNPEMTQMFDNPLIMEQTRQQVLANPTMMRMFEKMGLGSVFKDPKAYADHMNNVKAMLSNPEILKGLAEDSSETNNVKKKKRAKVKMDTFDEGDL